MQTELENSRLCAKKCGISESVIRKNRFECAGFLSESLSHDLKNVIGVISGYSDLGTMSTKLNECRKYFKISLESGHKAKNILDAFSIIASTHYLPDLDIFDLCDLIQSSICLLKFSTRRQNISITLEYNELKKFMIRADKEKLVQIIINLAMNSLSSINPEKRKGILGFRIYSFEKNAALSIYDNGSGMSQKMVSDLSLFIEDKSGNFDSEYAKTGLKVVKELVARHNAELLLKSSEGEGTEFTLLLPLVE